MKFGQNDLLKIRDYHLNISLFGVKLWILYKNIFLGLGQIFRDSLYFEKESVSKEYPLLLEARFLKATL